LTAALGDFHAAALDKTKQLYFTQESFDDFYYGKGSTYPDAHGSIGILFEQASSRGHLQDSVHGLLKFSDTIQNQVTTSLSTFVGALANKKAILDYQLYFAEQTKNLVKDDDLAGYILNEKFDQARFSKMLEILSAHQIQYYPLSKDVKVDGQIFDTVNSMFVPLDQPQYRLIKSFFSTRKSFDNNTFYDVSNWNLPLSFNIQYQAVERQLKLDKQPVKATKTVNPELLPGAYAYAFSWQDYQAPKLLQRLLANKVKIKLAGEAFFAQTSQGGKSFSAGAVIVPIALEQPKNLLGIIDAQNIGLHIPIHSVTSGLTRQGIDLGSRKMLNIALPKVLLVGGRSTSQYELGEVWHYLDLHVDMPVSITDLDQLGKLSLDSYTHMIWVEGTYKGVADTTVSKIEDWLNKGGILIGQKSAANWFSDKKWLKAGFKSTSEVNLAFETTGMTYKDQEALKAKQRIAGAVFETQLDLSHPLAFGYTSTTLPMFRNSALVMRQPDKPFITAASYTKSPLMAGYTADELQQLIGGSAAIVSHNFGKGKVIGFATNVNFRGVWYGTSRLMSNAIFMAGFINAQG
jgi:hypothetical protein